MRLTVLSLFDGMSCGLQALKNLGIPISAYYSSEVDKHAIQVSRNNHPEIEQFRLGDVRNINPTDLPPIDLLIGGSPCQNFSFSGRQQGMIGKESKEIRTLDHYLSLKEEGFEFYGQSYLFWEYVRLLKSLKPQYFLLENVVMAKKWKKIFDEVMWTEGICINSADFNAQSRKRLFWTNIPTTSEPVVKSGEVVKDILEEVHIPEEWLEGEFIPITTRPGKTGMIPLGGLLKPTHTIWTKKPSGRKDENGNDIMVRISKDEVRSIGDFRQPNRVYSIEGKSPCLTTACWTIFKIGNQFRRLLPLECDRLQGLPDDYTAGVSNRQRYKMLGNGWSVPVIEHIFQSL